MYAKTSEKCKTIDKETANYLKNSGKLEELKKELFEKHQFFLDSEGTDPCNIWIVCDKSKMDNANKELTDFLDENTISSSTFKPTDPIKFRFLNEHCRKKVAKEERTDRCKVEGVSVNVSAHSFEVKGTQKGRKDMICFLENLSGKVDCKVCTDLTNSS